MLLQYIITMLITLYTPIGIVYQKFNINETDITYGDLLKYINLPKNDLYNELYKSEWKWDNVFIKTIINLFSYNEINSKEIKLDDEILCDSYEFTILCSYEYYLYCCEEEKNKKIENNIKNYNININDINGVKGVIKNDPYQIIFVDYDNKNYEEICKLAVGQNGNVLQCIPPELMTDEICKLAIKQYTFSLQYVPPELMTDEICKLAVKQDGHVLAYVKEQTEEICKLAVQKNSYAWFYVKEEFQTEEIFKLYRVER